MVQTAKEEKPKGNEVKEREARFFLIKLHSKRADYEPDIVPVNVNGRRLNIKREEIVPVEEMFVHALRNAKHPHWTAEPGKSRKIARYVERYPFNELAEISERSYNQLRKKVMDGKNIDEGDVAKHKI